MSITVSLTREIQGANVVYQFVADTINKADEMARFLAGATVVGSAKAAAAMTAPYGEKGPSTSGNEAAAAERTPAEPAATKTKEKAAPSEKDPEAKKPQLSGSASTQTSQPEASDTSKTYGYEEVKNLVVAVLKDKGRDTAAACLARVGLKVLPKDCKDAEVLNSLGALAEGVLAGTVDVMAGEALEA